MEEAKFLERFWGWDYFRDRHGNIYTKIGEDIFFCSNLKRGSLTPEKAEPSYEVNDIILKY